MSAAGYLVIGVSELRIERARRVHEMRGAHWSAETFARLAIAHPLRPEPFPDIEQAEHFAELARRLGALEVKVRPVGVPP